jgi:CTP:molybdopterin cytidylyltransferase MocA
MKLACLLTAAGSGSRFGEDKLRLSVGDTPMGIHALEVLQQVPFAFRALVTSEDKQYLIEAAKRKGISVVINPNPERGMGSSVRLGTEHILRSGAYDGILYAVADQPNLRAATVERIVQAFAAAPEYIWAPMANGRRGNPVIFPVALFDELLQVTGDRGGRQVISAHGELLRTIRVSEEEMKDIDTKEDIYLC